MARLGPVAPFSGQLRLPRVEARLSGRSVVLGTPVCLQLVCSAVFCFESCSPDADLLHSRRWGLSRPPTLSVLSFPFLLPCTGSFNTSDASLSNGYQQSPADFSIGSGGNMSSMSMQRITSQMIPTPGYNSNSNQSYMNLESARIGGGFSTIESTIVSQPQQQKQHVGGWNSRILHNLGSQMGSGIRSSLQQKSYGFSNGSLNGGLGMNASNLPLVNGPGSSENYLSAIPYSNSPKPSHQHFDQHQRPLLQGDGYGMSNVDMLKLRQLERCWFNS